ncbi:MAG: DUF2227 family putative metal-binding protein [Candidatus Ratteibacteria bacterium]|nr:DUF2227 family putative metal-binding protein [Candidatus Ratteibacteria bacterium]
MPSYTNHLIANFAAALILLFFYQKNPFLTDTQLGIAIFGYFLGTIVLNPDLDSAKSKPAQKCGIICKPYTMMSKHRGTSHHWLWGTVTRIMYILLIIGLLTGLAFVLKLPIPDITFILTHPFEILMLIVGIFIANVLHTATDAIF